MQRQTTCLLTQLLEEAKEIATVCTFVVRATRAEFIPENSVRAFRAAISALVETKSQYPTSKYSFQPGHLLQMAAFLGKPQHSGMKLMAHRSSYAERTTKAASILEGSALAWAGATLGMAGRRFPCPAMRC